MQMFTAPPEVFLHLDFVDFSKSINGLVGIYVVNQIQST
jgi:hypothetical protein